METVLDAIVVGGGIGGMTAANRLAQLGKKVAVLEAGADTEYLCNSRYTGGAVHICFRDPVKRKPEELVAEIGITSLNAAPALAQAIAEDGRRAITWLRDEGVKFAKGGAEEYKSWVLAPLRANTYGLMWKGRGGDVMLRTLGEALLKRGGTIHRGTRAVGLDTSNPDLLSLDVEEGGAKKRLSAKAIVFADGGFQGNPELVREYITPHPEKLLQRGAGTGNGDGLRMALSAGGKYVGGKRFYGHVLSREAFTNANLWPFPVIDPIVHAGLVVDGNAQRFADEGEGGVWVANQIAQLADPLSPVVIFDEAIWNGPAAHGVMAPNPNMVKGGGTMKSASSIAELAGLVGLPADALVRSVEAWNAAVAAGTTEALTPARTAKYGKPMPIQKAPFHAIPVCAGITYTMGGIAVDEHACVVDSSGKPISRLYAVGCTTGGLEGGPIGGYVGGLSKASVGGLRAAEHIAANLP